MAGLSCARIANTKVMLLFGRLLTQMSHCPGTDARPTAPFQITANWVKQKIAGAPKNESRFLGWPRCAHALLHAAFGSSASISDCPDPLNVEEMARISNVFRDVALLQILCYLLFGDAQGMSLALPIDDAFISQPRLPGVRTVLHLLASCRRLMMPHQNVMLQWKSDLDSDHGLFVNGEWSSPDRDSD